MSLPVSDGNYREIAALLIDYGRKRAEVEAVDRDQLIWAAHNAGMPKAEIAKFTGLSWATVDRSVRDMASQPDGSTEGDRES